MKIKLIVPLLAIGCVAGAIVTWFYLEAQQPTTREECYLENMQNVQTDRAATVARVACDRQFPEPVNRFQQLRETGNVFDRFHNNQSASSTIDRQATGKYSDFLNQGSAEPDRSAIESVGDGGTPSSASGNRFDQLDDDVAPTAPAEEQPTVQNDEYPTITEKHPDWLNIVRTTEFANWLQQQPESSRALADSVDPEDAIKLLNYYPAFRNSN